MSITSICERGTMMSRACSSETCSTPSIIDERVGVEQVALVRGAQQLDQLIAIFGLAHR